MKVLVAMSGGVDSSVAAALLLDAGHDVTGVTMKLWGGASDNGCCAISDTDDARRVARQLGIDHHVFNFGDEFDQHVVRPYVEAHAAGRTPNPCIECNRHLKFDKLLRRADALGFEIVATGHHARLVSEPTGGTRLARGADPAKDQSYVLHMLDASQRVRVLFPVGSLTKSEVRSLAAERGLDTANKPDSQDVCFITSTEGRARFLAERTAAHGAEVVDPDGRRVGRVDHVQTVTIGQRKGLGLAGGDDRRYVVSVDVPGRRVTVGGLDELLTPRQCVDDLVWVGDPIEGCVDVQTSAHGTTHPATVRSYASDTSGEFAAEIVWSSPTRRVAPGQAIVLYLRDLVVGSGTASTALPGAAVS